MTKLAENNMAEFPVAAHLYAVAGLFSGMVAYIHQLDLQIGEETKLMVKFEGQQPDGL